ncbi:MAG: hypothetical protein ACI8R4_002330 [Paracoccaceae bacterium]|jgi:hypothetical protein
MDLCSSPASAGLLFANPNWRHPLYWALRRPDRVIKTSFTDRDKPGFDSSQVPVKSKGAVALQRPQRKNPELSV